MGNTMATQQNTACARALRDLYTDLPTDPSLIPARSLLAWGFRRGHRDTFCAGQFQHAHAQNTSSVRAEVSSQRSHQFDLFGT